MINKIKNDTHFINKGIQYTMYGGQPMYKMILANVQGMGKRPIYKMLQYTMFSNTKFIP